MTDAPERIWANVTVWSLDQALAGEWNHCNVNSPEDTEYVRKDATFTANDLRRAWEMCIAACEVALLETATTGEGDDYDDYCSGWMQGAAHQNRRDAFAIRALTPPDDLPAWVKEGRDE